MDFRETAWVFNRLKIEFATLGICSILFAIIGTLEISDFTYCKAARLLIFGISKLYLQNILTSSDNTY